MRPSQATPQVPGLKIFRNQISQSSKSETRNRFIWRTIIFKIQNRLQKEWFTTTSDAWYRNMISQKRNPQSIIFLKFENGDFEHWESIWNFIKPKNEKRFQKPQTKIWVENSKLIRNFLKLKNKTWFPKSEIRNWLLETGRFPKIMIWKISESKKRNMVFAISKRNPKSWIWKSIISKTQNRFGSFWNPKRNLIFKKIDFLKTKSPNGKSKI